MREILVELSKEKETQKKIYNSGASLYNSFSEYWKEYITLMKDDNRIIEKGGTKYIIFYEN